MYTMLHLLLSLDDGEEKRDGKIQSRPFPVVENDTMKYDGERL